MVMLIDWGVPEGHYRITHIFIDRRAVLQQHIGHRRQEIVQQLGQLGWIQSFRQVGKSSYVAKQQRQFAVFTTQNKSARVASQLIDQRRSQIAPERLADEPFLVFTHKQPHG